MIGLIWTLGLFILSIYLLIKYFSGNKDYWEKMGVRTIDSGWSLTKKITNAQDLLGIMTDLYKDLGNDPYGGNVVFRKPGMMVRDPELLKKIMVKDFDHFQDRREFNSDKLFKRMLTILEGQEWKEMRTTLSPTFTTGKIRRMFDQVFLKCSNEFVNYIKSELGKTSGNDLDLRLTFGKYTLAVISSAAFGIESNSFDESSIFAQKAFKLINLSPLAQIKIGMFFMFPKLAELLKLQPLDSDSVNFLKDIVHTNIQLREKQNEKRNDFFQLMLEAKWGSLKKDEGSDDLSAFEKDAMLKDSDKIAQNTKLTNDDLVSQTFLFFFAGFETVGAATGFTFYNLAVHQEWQEKVYKEVQDVISQHGGKLCYDAVQKMEILDRCISETLRLYPPAFINERRCTQEYRFPGTNVVIKPNQIVQIPIFSMQRDPEFFPDPLKFDPNRFSPENKDKINPYSYAPFGAGPRNCIGMRFALTEIKCLIANFLVNLKIEPCAKTQIPLKFTAVGGTLKATEGLVFKITPRVN